MKFFKYLIPIWIAIFFTGFIVVGIYDFVTNDSYQSLFGAISFAGALLFFFIIYKNGGFTHTTYFIAGVSLIALSILSAYSIASKQEGLAIGLIMLYIAHFVMFASGVLMVTRKMRPVLIYIRKNDWIRDYGLIALIILGTIHLILNWNF